MLNDKNCLKSKRWACYCALKNVQKFDIFATVEQASARTMTRINFSMFSTGLINYCVIDAIKLTRQSNLLFLIKMI